MSEIDNFSDGENVKITSAFVPDIPRKKIDSLPIYEAAQKLSTLQKKDLKPKSPPQENVPEEEGTKGLFFNLGVFAGRAKRFFVGETMKKTVKT